MIEYKGYVGVFEFDEESKIFRGRVSNIDDLVTFQGKSIKEIKETFVDSVKEYISWCKQYRNEPKRLHSLLKEKGKENGPADFTDDQSQVGSRIGARRPEEF